MLIRKYHRDFYKFFLQIWFFSLIIISSIWLIPGGIAENVTIMETTEPFITIDPIGNHAMGEVFFINGTTNLPVTENLSLLIEPTWVFHQPMRSKPINVEYINIPIFHITSDPNSMNRWSVNETDMAHWLDTGENYVVVKGENTSASDGFTLHPAITDTTYQNDSQNRPNSSTSLINTNQTETYPTTQSSSLPVMVMIAVIPAIILIKMTCVKWKWK